MNRDLKLFALDASKDFGEKVAASLGVPLSKHSESTFHDGEVYIVSDENVRETDVYVIHSLYGDDMESVNDKLMKLLIFIGSLHDASAYRVTAVLPYFCYARQDRKTGSRVPVTTKYITHLFECLKTRRILTIDAHNPGAFQNASWDARFDNLEANGLFAKYVANDLKAQYGSSFSKNLVVMSPDEGGLKRARRCRTLLQHYLGEKVGIACMDKTHEGLEIKGNGIMGKVGNKYVVIIDDMISSGKTILECIETAKQHGAASVVAVFATHGLFVGDANKYLDTDFLHNIVVTDTIPPFRITNPNVFEKITVIHTDDLFAEAIRRTHKGESISALIERNGVDFSSTKMQANHLLKV
jgi:ribose-phosphate pyrophosphokinase